MSDSFSFSDDEQSGSQKQDWEQAAEKAAQQQQKEQEEQQREKEEAERIAAEQALRNRKREMTNQTVELDEEAVERLQRKQREAQTAKLVNNFMNDSDDDSSAEHERRKQQNKISRNYELEDEFFAGGQKPKEEPKAEQSIKSEPMKLPKTLTEFEKYGDEMIEKIVATHKRENGQGNDALYMAMLKRIVRGVLKPMFVEDAKELSDVCAQIANELIASSKRNVKGKAKKPRNNKPQINTYKGNALDDDDDFM